MPIRAQNKDTAAEHLGMGTLLRLAYQAMMSESVEPALAQAGFGDIRSAHLPVFRALASFPAGMRSTELASYAGITKQSMGYLVDHLEAGGYVERVPEEADQRAKVVRLTDRGWKAGGRIRDLVLEVEAEWGRRVGVERVRQLRAILQDLVTSYER